MYADNQQFLFEQAIIRDPLTIAASATVAEAIALMSKGGQACSLSCDIDTALNLQLAHAQNSCVLVTEGKKLIGILTEHDLIKLGTETVNNGEFPQKSVSNLLETAIAEVMTYPVQSLLEWEFIDILVPINRFHRFHIRHLPLVNDLGEVVGLLTHESLRQLLRPIDMLRLRQVKEIMVTDVVCARQMDSVAKVANLILESSVSSVVVVEELENALFPIGIVTEGDIIQYLALGLDLFTSPVQLVMSFPPVSIDSEETLWDVRELMQERMINHVLITSADGRLEGIVSQADLLGAIQPTEIYKLVSILETKMSRLEQENLELLKSRNKLLESQVQERTTALAHSNDMFRQFADNNRGVIVIRELSSGKLLYVSPRYAEIWGKSNESLYQDPDSWMQSIHPDDQERIAQAYTLTAFSGCFSEEYRIVRPDGDIRWIWGRCFPLKNSHGEIEQIAAVVEDISNRKRQDLHLAKQRQILELIAQGAELSQILTAIVQFIESQSHQMYCSILRVEGKKLVCGIAPSLPKSYIKAIEGIEIGEYAGSCGTAMYRKAPVIVTDIATDPLWQNHRDFALEVGLLACWSIPIFAKSGIVLGSLAMYYPEIRTPSDDEMELVSLVINLASLAIERKQVETALRESESNQKNLIDALPDLIIRMSGDGTYLDFFPTETFNIFDTKEIIGKNIYNTDFPIDLAETRMQYIRKALLTGKRQIYDQEIIIDGNLHVEEVRISVCSENEVLIIVRDISDRKWAEMALHRSEQRLRASESLLSGMFEQSAVGMAITDLDGKFIRTNPCYQEMIGYSERELASMRFTDNMLPEDIEENLRLRNLVLSNELESYHMEKRLLHRDNRTVWVKTTSSKIVNEVDRTPFFIEIIEDISDRKQDEAALQSLVEGAAAHTGEDFFPTLAEYIAKALGVSYVIVSKLMEDRLETIISWIDGKQQSVSIIPLSNTPCSLTIKQGKYCCPEKLKRYFPDCESVKDLPVESYLGRAIFSSSDKPIGSLCILDRKPIANLERADAMLRVFAARISAEIERQEAIDALYQLNQQLELRVEQRTSELQAANQQLGETNAELARATRLKDEFLANMSHELRTPLNAVLGMSEGLMSGVFGDVNDRQKRSLSLIETSGRHLLELINDILDVAKIGAGKLDLEISPVAIDYLCQSSLNLVRQAAQKRNVQLRLSIHRSLKMIAVDERRMRQALINLLSNAVKFTSNGGNVKLEVKLQDIEATTLKASPEYSHAIVFSVTDTGIGISPADICKLFQAFVQIDSSLNRQYSGTGLGLTLVKQIAELHGGCVTVNSQIGQGSCFSIFLPYELEIGSVDSVDREQTHSVTKYHGEEGLEKLENPENLERKLLENSLEQDLLINPLILLADDNPINIETFANYLTSRGYRVILAANGQEAIDLAITQKPNLVLMDIQMPVLDGIAAIEIIRANPFLKHIPIVALTALAMQSDREKCMAVGANEYLAKPVQLSHLTATIQRLLSSSA